MPYFIILLCLIYARLFYSNARQFYLGELVLPPLNGLISNDSVTDKQFLCCKICYKQVEIKIHKFVLILRYEWIITPTMNTLCKLGYSSLAFCRGKVIFSSGIPQG